MPLATKDLRDSRVLDGAGESARVIALAGSSTLRRSRSGTSSWAGKYIWDHATLSAKWGVV